MKVVFFVLALVACVCAHGTYVTKYDNVNLDQILRTDRLMDNYVKCLLDKGNCTPDGKALKEALPDALETDCSKCSEKQKHGSDKVIRFLVNERPEIWAELSAKYDSDGKHTVKFQDAAKKH